MTFLRVVVLTWAAAILAWLPGAAPAQEVHFHLRPALAWTQWDDAVGLEDGRFIGGGGGIGFGRQVDVTGFYLQSNDRLTDFGSLPFTAGTSAGDQYVDITSYGGELALELAPGSVAPVLMGGAGVLRFRPEVGEEIQRVQLRYGLGIRTFLSDALQLEVLLAQNRYFLDALDLAAPPSAGEPALPSDPGAGSVRRNLAVRAGLGFGTGGGGDPRRDGGRALDDRTRTGYEEEYSAHAFVLEPFAGRQTFDSRSALESRAIAGMRAGLGIGPHIGLFGFYWQGTHDARNETKGYGGEAQFSFGSTSLLPYLLAGGGTTSLTPADRGNREDHEDNRAAVILGGGIEIGISPAIRLNAAARDYIWARSDLSDEAMGLGDVRDPGDLAHNWQLSAGLSVRVGGGRANRSRPPIPDDEEEVYRDVPLETQPPAPPPEAPAPPTETEADITEVEREVRIESGSPPPPTIVVIPIGLPAQPGAPPDPTAAGTIDQFHDLLRAEIERATESLRTESGTPGSGVTEADLAEMEARLVQLVESRLNELEQQAGEPARTQIGVTVETPQADTVPGDPVEAETVFVDEPVAGRLDPSLGFPARELRPYTGIQWGKNTQWFFGVAVDRGPSEHLPAFDIVPEASLAFGQAKPTWMVAANAQYRPSWVIRGETFWINPLASLGLGLLNQDGTEFVVNAAYGVNIQLKSNRGDGGDPVNLHLAHHGVDLFGRSRLIVGLSLDR